MPEGIRFMTKYDPNREIPMVTPEIQLRLTKRHGALWKEPVDKKLTHAERFNRTEASLSDAEWFEVLFIAAIIGAAVDRPLRTVGDTWKPITWMAKGSPRVKDWGEAKMQTHIATAADTVIRLMSA